jgi:hypothetical protein
MPLPGHFSVQIYSLCLVRSRCRCTCAGWLYQIKRYAGDLGAACSCRTRQHAGMRLNASGPSPTQTAFVDMSSEIITDEFITARPFPSLGRIATAEEQAWPLILLNCSLNGAVSGSFLYTDQGFASGFLTGAISAAFMGG